VKLWHCLLIGLSLRLLWLLMCPNEPSSDQMIYDAAAHWLSQGRGYIGGHGQHVNYWPVGYPAVLGVVYRVLGPAPLSAFALNLVLGAGTIAFSYLLAKRLYGPRAGAFSALVLAIHPTFVLHATLFASEGLFIPLTLAFAVWWTQPPKRLPWLLSALIGGLLVGITTYVRPTALLLLCAIPVVILSLSPAFGRTTGLALSSSNRKRVVIATALAGFGAFLVLLPWGFRNQQHFQRFELISQNGGSNLWMGNNPASRGTYMPVPADVEPLGAVEGERVLKQRAIAFIKENPARYLVLCLRRVAVSLASDTSSVVWNETGIVKALGPGWLPGLKLLCTVVHWLLLITAGAALALSLRRRDFGRSDLVIGTLILLSAVPFVFVVGGNRYMLPMIPFLIIWSSRLFSDGPPAQTYAPSI
jgi:hypothetical protein